MMRFKSLVDLKRQKPKEVDPGDLAAGSFYDSLCQGEGFQD